MVENFQESIEKERNERRLKELEYKLAKSKIKSNYGKRALEELNNLYDYKKGMFNHLK